MPPGYKEERWRPVDHGRRVCVDGGHDLSGANVLHSGCRACSWARAVIRAARLAGEIVLPGDRLAVADELYAIITADRSHPVTDDEIRAITA